MSRRDRPSAGASCACSRRPGGRCRAHRWSRSRRPSSRTRPAGRRARPADPGGATGSSMPTSPPDSRKRSSTASSSRPPTACRPAPRARRPGDRGRPAADRPGRYHAAVATAMADDPFMAMHHHLVALDARGAGLAAIAAADAAAVVDAPADELAALEIAISVRDPSSRPTRSRTRAWTRGQRRTVSRCDRDRRWRSHRAGPRGGSRIHDRPRSARRRGRIRGRPRRTCRRLPRRGDRRGRRAPRPDPAGADPRSTRPVPPGRRRRRGRDWSPDDGRSTSCPPAPIAGRARRRRRPRPGPHARGHVLARRSGWPARPSGSPGPAIRRRRPGNSTPRRRSASRSAGAPTRTPPSRRSARRAVLAEELGDLDELFRVYANLTTVLDLAGRHEEAVAVASRGDRRGAGGRARGRLRQLPARATRRIRCSCSAAGRRRGR